MRRSREVHGSVCLATPGWELKAQALKKNNLLT
jgi:hypothetical protein